MSAAADAVIDVRPKWRRGRLWILLAVAAFVAIAGWRFDINEAPIRETRLESTFVHRLLGHGAWRELPFHVSLEERDDQVKCLDMAVLYRSTDGNGRSPFLDDSVRDDLLALLDRRANYFYAEYFLSLWYERSGDSTAAARYRAVALEHAPIVLIQPFVRPDGSPAAGVNVGEMSIECNRVEKGFLNPDLKLTFLNLTTDEQGRVYLPVYDTVYRVDSRSFPDGYELEFPTLGWFHSPRPQGVLPAVTLKPLSN